MNLKPDAQNCFNKGLLRRIPPSKEKAEGSIATAQKWLEEAEKNLKSKAYQSSVLSSYLAMFHSARAILFRDGVREKSHYCIARYLEEYYAKKKIIEMKWIDLLDHYRELRHNSQYTIDFFATQKDAENALQKIKEFVERIKSILKELEKQEQEKQSEENGR